jgi:RNA polymerase sigma-70 factor (ECF subfamily)
VADELELVYAAVAGDRIALDAIVRETHDHVWRYCAYLGPRRETEDLVQETYLRAFRAMPRYAGRSPLRVWILAIARRVCADALRHANRRNALLSLWTSMSSRQPDAADAIGITLLVDQLTAERRDAFVLTQLVGLTYAEVARLVGVPVGTVRSRVARAREDLQQELNQEVG